MENSKNHYKSIQQFVLKFLNKFDKQVSNPNLIMKYKNTTDSFINNSSQWTNIITKLKNSKNKEEYICKLQYIVYHCILYLTNKTSIKWGYYYNIVSELDIPIYLTEGHLKLILTVFQKINDITKEKPNYFENEDNRTYFAKNELLGDFNFFQLHYLHTVFGLEDFNINDYSVIYPLSDDYEWKYHPLISNSIDIKNKVEHIKEYYQFNPDKVYDYVYTVMNKLYHKDTEDDRTSNLTINSKQLSDLIYIMSSYKNYTLTKRFEALLYSMNDKQICFVGII